jgi:HlyD family secretion protein
VIFRKVALERLSSPEQLDQLLQVTSPKGWLALGALGVILLASLGWGIWGSIPTQSTGEGILLRQGGVSDVVTAAAGQMDEVLVKAGDVIEKGKPVARIRQDVIVRQIRDSQARLAALRAELAEMARSTEEQKRLRARDTAQQRANLQRSIETLEKDQALLAERVEAERKLLDDGLITKQTFITTQQTLNQKRDDLASQRLQLNGLDLKRLQDDQQLDQQITVRQSAIRDLELESRELNAKLTENVVVTSPYAGRVLEILAARGDVVSPGSPILSVEVVSEDLVAVLFVPAASGKQVQKGMRVRVSPSTVKREEYGSILGRVTWVAEFPSTARGMTRLLGNEALVTRLMTEGPPIQVDVALDRDPSTPTGFRWSSSRGPSVKISSGTLAAGDVILREDRPIRLLIPTLREKLGI